MGEKIALGFGNNTDYELVWDSQIFENLVLKWNIFLSDIIFQEKISSERDLVISILYFLRTETGGERVTEDHTLLMDFAKYYSYHITIGGTNPRSAIAMKKLGFSSCMHLVTLNDDIRALLPPNCPYVCSNKNDCADIHVIIQFSPDTIVSVNDIYIHTKRANRIIFDHDIYNCQMKLAPEFFDSFLDDATILMISGFNIVTDFRLLEKRLSFLRKKLEILKGRGVLIYYEDADFADDKGSEICKKYLFTYVDIFSLNEDELQNYWGKKLSLLAPLEILEVIEHLYKRFSVPLMVVHTKYWAIAYGLHACTYRDCLKGGVTMATTRFRFGDSFGKKEYEDTYKLPEEQEGKEFSREFNILAKGKGICISSVIVKEKKVTTIGLGDAFVGGFLPPLSVK